MRIFRRELAARDVSPLRRRWFYVPYDQLTADIGPLAEVDPGEAGIVLIEAPSKASRRPYHKQKLALVLANQRHFAIEQASRGVAIRYEVVRGSYADALLELSAELGPLEMMDAAERELRVSLMPLVAGGRLKIHEHAGWLSTRADFIGGAGKDPPWRMDAFYRRVRGRTGILMEKGKPVGGKYSFDAENRKPWRGKPPAPGPPKFVADAITLEVAELVTTRFAHHPGTLDVTTLPASAADAESVRKWARSECVPNFGPHEDAMSTHSTGLFHTRVAGLLNLHRLLPARVVNEVANDEDVPLASREGFVRQILGWREFVRHVHVETDGFRSLEPAGKTKETGTAPARDGGFGRWRGQAWPTKLDADEAGANPQELGATEPLPPAYWGARSGLACLDHVVESVWREGYSHHITRLMILSNIATLLGLSSRELTDWFWVAYIDAYDWVVEPNVLGMGTFSTGEVMSTKPYVSGAAYIKRMSNYCETCAFDPAKDCPLTRMYWAFLARHSERFGKNPRFAGPIASVRKRAIDEREEDVRVLGVVREGLRRGELLSPASLVKTRATRS